MESFLRMSFFRPNPEEVIRWLLEYCGDSVSISRTLNDLAMIQYSGSLRGYHTRMKMSSKKPFFQ